MHEKYIHNIRKVAKGKDAEETEIDSTQIKTLYCIYYNSITLYNRLTKYFARTDPQNSSLVI
jgi:hypothetical protein